METYTSRTATLTSDDKELISCFGMAFRQDVPTEEMSPESVLVIWSITVLKALHLNCEDSKCNVWRIVEILIIDCEKRNPFVLAQKSVPWPLDYMKC